MNDLPLITIAIPTYNRVEYLKQALASAQAQTYPNLEIIVSDNASSDGTEEFMERVMDKRVHYVRQLVNIGMVGNWNFCLNKTNGQYFLLLSDDDFLLPNCIITLVDLYRKNTNAPFCYGFIESFGEDKADKLERHTMPPSLESPNSITEAFFISGRPTFACGMMFKVNGRFKYTRYDESYSLLFDAKFWMTIANSSNEMIVFSDKKVGAYRVHSNSESNLSSREKWLFETEKLIDDIKIISSIEKSRINLIKYLNEAKYLCRDGNSIITRIRKILKISQIYKPPRKFLAKYILKSLIPEIIIKSKGKIFL